MSAVASIVDSGDEKIISKIYEGVPYSRRDVLSLQRAGVAAHRQTQSRIRGASWHKESRSTRSPGSKVTARSTSSLTTTAMSSAPTSRCRTARLRAVRPGASRRGHAADHLAHLRRLPHRASHGRHQGARRSLQSRPSAGREEDPRTDLQHLHVEDHALHFYFLGGPDFVVGPTPPRRSATSSACWAKWVWKSGKKSSACATVARLDLSAGGKVIHPVFGLPGGIAKAYEGGRSTEVHRRGERGPFRPIQPESLQRCRPEEFRVCQVDHLGHVHAQDLLHGSGGRRRTSVNFYDGRIRVVDPDGKEFGVFAPRDYLDHVAEHVEPWSYIKFPFEESRLEGLHRWRG